MATFDQSGNELEEVKVTAKRIQPLPVQVEDLPEVTVRARRYNWQQWLRPPGVFYAIAAVFAAVYISQPKRRKRRR